MKKLFFIVSFITFNLFGQRLFVSPSGSDFNSGIKPGEPLASIEFSLQKAVPGTEINLLPGIYKKAFSINSILGGQDNEIIIKSYSDNPDSFAVIDGGDKIPTADSSSFWMFINNSSWIKIAKLKFKNAWSYPILLKNSSYITFDSCFFWGGKRVINAEGNLTHHLLIENCYWDQGGKYLWKIGKDSLGVEAWLSMHHENMSYFNGSLIDFHKTGGSIVIRNNKIIYAFNAFRWRGEKGYDSNIQIYNNHISYVRDNDFEPEYYTYNLHIYNNFSHNVHRTLSIDNNKGGNIYYYGNVITSDNDSWTEKVITNIWKIYGKERNLSFPVYAFNNSFYSTGNAFRVDVGDLVRVKHFNNAYYFSSPEDGWLLDKWDSTNEFDYDISNKNWPENIINHNQEKHGKIADIKFVDPSNWNLQLQENSPGIDAGKVISFKEFNWKQDYEGKAPDVGAYENGKLVEGPPFRFLFPPETEFSYKEKPRIVKHDINENKLTVYFSAEIDTSTLKKEDVILFNNKNKIPVLSVSFSDENYAVTFETAVKLIKENLSISFKKMPVGTNGEKATFWASTIKIKK